MTATPNTLRVTVSFTLDIDADEWTRQFPDENTADKIAAEVNAQVQTMVRDHYLDMGWTATYRAGDRVTSLSGRVTGTVTEDQTSSYVFVEWDADADGGPYEDEIEADAIRMVTDARDE